MANFAVWQQTYYYLSGKNISSQDNYEAEVTDRERGFILCVSTHVTFRTVYVAGKNIIKRESSRLLFRL